MSDEEQAIVPAEDTQLAKSRALLDEITQMWEGDYNWDDDWKPFERKACLKVCLYDISTPVIIVKAPTGVVYYNQTNGCACNQPEAEGYLIPLPKSEARVFDPSWWYSGFYGIPQFENVQKYKEEHNIEPMYSTDEHGLKYYTPEQSQAMRHIYDAVAAQQQEALGAADISFEEVTHEIEAEVNKMYCGAIKNFRIDHEFTGKKHWNSNQEAWLHCLFEVEVDDGLPHSSGDEHSLYTKRWRTARGILSWENSD